MFMFHVLYLQVRNKTRWLMWHKESRYGHAGHMYIQGKQNTRHQQHEETRNPEPVLFDSTSFVLWKAVACFESPEHLFLWIGEKRALTRSLQRDISQKYLWLEYTQWWHSQSGMTPFKEDFVSACLVLLTLWCLSWAKVTRVETEDTGISEVRIRHHKNREHSNATRRHHGEKFNVTLDKGRHDEDKGYVHVPEPTVTPATTITPTTTTVGHNITESYTVYDSYGTSYPWWVHFLRWRASFFFRGVAMRNNAHFAQNTFLLPCNFRNWKCCCSMFHSSSTVQRPRKMCFQFSHLWNL